LAATVGSIVRATVEPNVHFHFPKRAAKVLLIGNGTGIGPYLGMLEENRSTPVELYWGGKSGSAYELFRPAIETALAKDKLEKVELAFSRENGKARYVQDLLRRGGDHVPNILSRGGKVMICGSLAMQKGVMEELNTLTQNHLGKPLEEFTNRGQVLSDCY
jgi:sulfite reductase (NADPH) flavoprotein alpha-component